MKTRKLIKGMMAVAIVAVAGLAIFANQSKEHKSDVMLANIEALASGESSTLCKETCYPYYSWRCTRIYNGVTSICEQHRKI